VNDSTVDGPGPGHPATLTDMNGQAGARDLLKITVSSLRGIALIALAMLTAPALPVLADDSAAATGEVSAAADPEVLYKQGKTSFRKRCARCHGVNMVNPGVGVFDLRTFPLDDKARFIDSVSNGRNAMPAWKAVLKPADIDALWVYVSAGQ
jgi:mono/diheme cytochrome c family protein